MQGTKTCSHMFGRGAFMRLMEFLLGPKACQQASDSEQVRLGGPASAYFVPIVNRYTVLVNVR